MGQSTQHHRFRFASVVVLVSARGSASPRAGAGELHRQCFASVSQCAGAQIWKVSARLRIVWKGHRCARRCSHSTTVGTPPQRPPASLLHNAALPSVAASHCAKATFGVAHRLRALRVKATGVMQSGLRWRRSHSRRRFPFAFAPYAPPSARPCGCACTVASVRRCALCVWSVAYGQLCGVCPRPPVGLAAARLWPRAELPVRPPKGAPSVSAPLALLASHFAIKYVASSEINTGATGRYGL